MFQRYVNTERGRIAYWISEQRKEKTIVFTHGVTGDHTLFERQVAFWEKKYTVILWDMPLHGISRPYRDFSLRNAAKDMRQILDTEDISHAIMAGHSAGGYPAQSFAQEYPDRTDAFISIDSTPYGMKYYKKSELFWTNHYSDIAKWYPYGIYCKQSTKAAAMTEEARKTFYECLVRLGKKGMLEAAAAVYKDFPNYDEVQFTCPVLLVLGEHDNLGYVRKYNEHWCEETGFPLLLIPNAAHMSNYDNYNFFNEKVEEFLIRVL